MSGDLMEFTSWGDAIFKGAVLSASIILVFWLAGELGRHDDE